MNTNLYLFLFLLFCGDWEVEQVCTVDAGRKVFILPKISYHVCQ